MLRKPQFVPDEENPADELTDDDFPISLRQYRRSPEEILNGRVLPPLYPKDKPRGQRGMFKVGRLPKYESPEALQYAIDLYFEGFKAQDPDNPVQPTVPGLAFALGFSNKANLKRYGDRSDAFRYVIDRAYTRIETMRNEQLLKGGSTTAGTQFDLVNHHGWTNKVEQTVNADQDTLKALVQSMQGRVLRPVLPIKEDEVIEDAEIEEVSEEVETETAYAEEVTEKFYPMYPRGEYAEDAEIILDEAHGEVHYDMSDLL